MVVFEIKVLLRYLEALANLYSKLKLQYRFYDILKYFSWRK